LDHPLWIYPRASLDLDATLHVFGRIAFPAFLTLYGYPRPPPASQVHPPAPKDLRICRANVRSTIDFLTMRANRLRLQLGCGWLCVASQRCFWLRSADCERRTNNEVRQNIPCLRTARDYDHQHYYRYVDYAMNHIRLLKHHNITPFVVLDGGPLPAKRGTESSRQASRDDNRVKAIALSEQGKHAEAQPYYTKALDVTPEMAFQFIKVQFPVLLISSSNLTRPRRH